MRFLVPILVLFSAMLASAHPNINFVGGVGGGKAAIAPRGIAVARGIEITDDAGATEVTVNGVIAVILPQFTTPGTEVYFHVPPSTAIGSATVVITADGFSSTPFGVAVYPFAIDAFSDGAAYHLDKTAVSGENPALPGENLLVTGLTGLGEVNRETNHRLFGRPAPTPFMRQGIS